MPEINRSLQNTAPPSLIDGFPAYAPELAHSGPGFRPEYFATLAAAEDKHFWFIARNALVLWALQKYAPGFESFLEIGCGTGQVLSAVARGFPEAEIYGSELFTAGLKFAAERAPKAKLMQMDATNIPFAGQFDVIGAFDVLEHIENDALVLQQIHKALKPGGLTILTVPQHSWMWSPSDAHACHVRRYAAKELQQKVERAGFNVLRSSSFVSLLLPAMWLSRLAQTRQKEGSAELDLPEWMNSIFKIIMRAELNLIKVGTAFPCGGSRLVIAKK